MSANISQNIFVRKNNYHRTLLSLLTSDKPLKDALRDLVLLIENEANGMFGSVLLVSPDRLHLMEGGAPSLPGFYNEAIDGIDIGEGVGSCGTAAFTGKRVIVEDISAHPYWDNFRVIALQANLQACWSQPIHKNGIVLGTFALYYSKPQAPDEYHINLIEEAAGLAKVLIDKAFSGQLIDEKERALESAAETARWKSSFFANMSHEIRTPLNGIVGALDLLTDTELDSHQEKWLNVINFSTSNLLRIVDDILDVSKINGGMLSLENTVFDFHQLLESLLSAYRLNSDRNIEVISIFDENVPLWVEADPTRLQQIIGNLLSNAFKFTNEGKVELSVKTLTQEDQISNLLFEVKDTGMGMDKEQVDRIFGQYEQADSSTTRQFGGSGLGLFICKELVGLFGGDIWVDSKPGVGSIFSVRLSLNSAEPPLVIHSIEEQPADYSGINVLLVEDNDINTKIIAAILKGMNVNLTTAINGQQGVDAFCDVDNKFDLIFMDCEMPIIDGYEATQLIRAWEQENGGVRVPICALTAHAMGEHIEKCFLSGMDHHLAKPVTKARVESILVQNFSR